MNILHTKVLITGLASLLLVAVPFFASGYHLALSISLLSYGILAIAWAMFSGPTRYVSLATAAFFGIGAYTGAVIGESVAWWIVLLTSGIVGAVIALIVGLSTLRLSGIYFVIFTFGLSELIRQLVTWYEVNITKSVGRYLFLDITQEQIYWQLVCLFGLVIVVGLWIARSRLGFAVRLIGEDEVAARHSGVNTTQVKLTIFVISACFLSLTGAVMSARWTYIDPTIAFNPTMSFMIIIMALLGGTTRVLDPLLGVVPLVLLFDVLTATFPNYFSVVLGLTFIIIVYFLPHGVSGFVAGRLSGILVRDAPEAKLTSVSPPTSPSTFTPTFTPSTTPIEKPIDVQCSPLLKIDGLTRTFGGLVAVDQLNMTVHKGKILGLIGPNGSGKTTALNLMSGALRPSAGTIKLDGRSIETLPAHQIARLGIARTFQLVRVFRSMNCMENVHAGLAFRLGDRNRSARQEVEGLLAQVGLADKRLMRADQLTYIDQKRLELARALALKPSLLLLDEWLAGLNPSELHVGIDLIETLRRSGVTIIMVEHLMDAVRSLCDHCIVMNAGRKIADGPPVNVLADPEVIRAYLGDDLDA
ncbi:ABC transporter permease subunit [Bradyrhizobium sp. AUGA SZCCT0182]|uniref:branched-chain amino acid ABC transporter ATP-binding protein/permease n=1 Tax=Bradyrhizobium sp. AUGA SZCCT0182 TaxID=2807667 RepID=UPI001BABE7A9|nr:branched-chain amino acid ABC transporter ATP-binding protein/permease [Bradyrhizobium sp. AUGA SZCCT0182]MBR1235908.1 branched-chain amino acid ABC transporter ATP-binding protein/permease [Bradyrhizobium sp. AUGA SZCCT0182]